MKFKSLKEMYIDGDIVLEGMKADNPVMTPEVAFKLRTGKELYTGDEPPWDVDE